MRTIRRFAVLTFTTLAISSQAAAQETTLLCAVVFGKQPTQVDIHVIFDESAGKVNGEPAHFVGDDMTWKQVDDVGPTSYVLSRISGTIFATLDLRPEIPWLTGHCKKTSDRAF